MQLGTELSIYKNNSTLVQESSQSSSAFRTPEELVSIVENFASSNGWLERVRFRTESRWYERLHHGADYDIWAISWMPGQSTGFHDHGESSGAFLVASGTLEEHRPGQQALAISQGQLRRFGTDYAHDVRNVSLAPAISIHAYSPPLSEMNEYELDGKQLVPRPDRSEDADGQDREWRTKGAVSKTEVLSIEQMLTAARRRLRRLSPLEAYEASTKAEAILVDIRPEAQRAREGCILGALIVERNVLEWRFDPTSDSRLPVVIDHHLQVIVFCSEGYTSSLAAAALQDLGLWRATDMEGGFCAWQTEGLPNQQSEIACLLSWLEAIPGFGPLEDSCGVPSSSSSQSCSSRLLRPERSSPLRLRIKRSCVPFIRRTIC